MPVWIPVAVAAVSGLVWSVREDNPIWV